MRVPPENAAEAFETFTDYQNKGKTTDFIREQKKKKNQHISTLLERLSRYPNRTLAGAPSSLRRQGEGVILCLESSTDSLDCHSVARPHVFYRRSAVFAEALLNSFPGAVNDAITRRG